MLDIYNAFIISFQLHGILYEGDIKSKNTYISNKNIVVKGNNKKQNLVIQINMLIILMANNHFVSTVNNLHDAIL